MKLLALLIVFAVVQNLDNFVLAAAYRLKHVHITWRANLIIASLSGIATWTCMTLARGAKLHITEMGFGSTLDLLGRAALITVGCWTLLGCFQDKLFARFGERFARPRSSSRGQPIIQMSFRGAAILGAILAIDNLGPSVAFGLVHLSTAGLGIALSALTGLASIVCILAGQAAGARGQFRLKGNSSKVIGACLIIALGLLQPFDLAREALK